MLTASAAETRGRRGGNSEYQQNVHFVGVFAEKWFCGYSLGRLSELEQDKGREWWPVMMTS